MKITKCDACGKEVDGRNPSNMHEIINNAKDGYYDLCDQCYNIYNSKYELTVLAAKVEIDNWLKNEFLKGDI